MTFRLFRASGLPLLLEPEEVHTLKTLDAQGRWTELSEYERELRDNEDVKEINIEADNLNELKFVLEGFDSENRFVIDFKFMIIQIEDLGRDC